MAEEPDAAEVIDLQFQLMQCMQERTKQAEYAIQLEDKIKWAEDKIAELEKVENLLPQYVAKFQELSSTITTYQVAVQHLLNHLQGPPAPDCDTIHAWLKEQGFK